MHAGPGLAGAMAVEHHAMRPHGRHQRRGAPDPALLHRRGDGVLAGADLDRAQQHQAPPPGQGAGVEHAAEVVGGEWCEHLGALVARIARRSSRPDASRADPPPAARRSQPHHRAAPASPSPGIAQPRHRAAPAPRSPGTAQPRRGTARRGARTVARGTGPVWEPRASRPAQDLGEHVTTVSSGADMPPPWPRVGPVASRAWNRL